MMALHWQELFGQDKKTDIIDQVRAIIGSPPVTLAPFSLYTMPTAESYLSDELLDIDTGSFSIRVGTFVDFGNIDIV
jgi:hypothetical protein